MNLVYAQSNAVVATDGRSVRLRIGEPWYADDPFVLAHPASFGPEPPAKIVRGRAPVEQSTAVPGERRKTKRG